jgi:hypothetical protein
VQVDEPAQVPQASKGKPRRTHHGRHRRVGLGHPRRQQQPVATWQFDDEVRGACVKEMTQNLEAFAGMWVMRILDNDLKRLLLGGMSRVRRAP